MDLLCRLLTFFKNNFFSKFFEEHYQSGPNCLHLGYQKRPLARKELNNAFDFEEIHTLELMFQVNGLSEEYLSLYFKAT